MMFGFRQFCANGEWDNVAEIMMLNFSESGHTVFRGPSALERGNSKNKGEGKLTIHFCGDDKTVEAVHSNRIDDNEQITSDR